MTGDLFTRWKNNGANGRFLEWALSGDAGAAALRGLLARRTVERPQVFVGTGTCGLASGAADVLAAFRNEAEARGIDADIHEAGCLGFCRMEPLVEIQLPGGPAVLYGEMTPAEVPAIVETVLEGGRHDAARALLRFGDGPAITGIDPVSAHPFFAPQRRIVLSRAGRFDPDDLSAAIARGVYRGLLTAVTGGTPESTLEAVEKSGLRGRGGGGFPTGTKWRFAAREKADRKYVVMNADEGDPGAFMDRSVLESDPHSAIEGMILCGYAIGASAGYIYCRAEYPLAIRRLETALADAREAGLLGEDILGSGFDFDITVKMGAGAFVCGEETALLASIEGRRGMPRPRPPYPASSGLFGRPTVINNVESMANIGWIVSNGPEAYRAVGTPGSPGTKVFALSGKLERSGLAEVPMGISIGEIVEGIGGGSETGLPLKAVQIGGPSGACVPVDLWQTPVDYDELKKIGAMMGSGGLVVMDEGTCMVDVARFFLEFTTKESCGKCTPCREGTRRMLHILDMLTTRWGDPDEGGALARFSGLIELERIARDVQKTALCGLGQTAPNPVLSTLKYFRGEYEAHLYDRHCPAGVCTALKEYAIDADACVGCGRCKKQCPVNAIVGSPKKMHYIVDERCIGCGGCVDVCAFDAVTVS